MIRYFDAHCDTLTAAEAAGDGLYRNSGHIDIARAGGFSGYAQLFAIWLSDGLKGEEAVNYFEKIYRYMTFQAGVNADRLSLVSHRAALLKAEEEEKIALILSIEGGHGLGGRIENVARFHSMGVRLITLTWNGENELACGCFGRKNGGLTPFGQKVLEEMRRLFMIIDVSHLNERGFWEVMEGGGNIIASHSNSAAVCPHPRNLTDEQFLALVKNGGGTGINLYRAVVGGREGIDDVIAHIEHFLSLGGEDAIFMGADLDGIDQPPYNIDDISHILRLYEGLLKRNYKEDLLEKIFYTNLRSIVLRAL